VGGGKVGRGGGGGGWIAWEKGNNKTKSRFLNTSKKADVDGKSWLRKKNYDLLVREKRKKSKHDQGPCSGSWCVQ